jgi:hypothetical protein
MRGSEVKEDKENEHESSGEGWRPTPTADEPQQAKVAK